MFSFFVSCLVPTSIESGSDAAFCGSLFVLQLGSIHLEKASMAAYRSHGVLVLFRSNRRNSKLASRHPRKHILGFVWENDDYERPIETYPGYLGLMYDGSFLPEQELRPLEGFNLTRYSELVDEHGGTRQLNLILPTGTIKIAFSAYDDIARILDQLPTIKVYLDNGPPDGGPASGGTYLFFIADGTNDLDLEVSITALAEALKSDLGELEANA
jgi:hypothetical protein